MSPAAGHLTTPTVAGLPGLCKNFRPTTSKSSPILRLLSSHLATSVVRTRVVGVANVGDSLRRLSSLQHRICNLLDWAPGFQALIVLLCAAWTCMLAVCTVSGRRWCQTRLVQPSSTSINSGDCFVLVTPDTVFLWTGQYCNVIEKAKVCTRRFPPLRHYFITATTTTSSSNILQCFDAVSWAAGRTSGLYVFGILWCHIHRESKKTRHQTLVHNFTKYWPIFKILSL